MSELKKEDGLLLGLESHVSVLGVADGLNGPIVIREFIPGLPRGLHMLVPRILENSNQMTQNCIIELLPNESEVMRERVI